MPTLSVGFFDFMDRKLKYPILLVHGMGFRDGKISYWGRIPDALRRAGARVYLGGQDGNASVETNAAFLKVRLEEILAESGAEKVHIIAHSKGGLEARYLISTLKQGAHIASVTTIQSPHNGSRTMDKLMKLPSPLMKLGCWVTDLFHRISGDKCPQTYRCLEQLTTKFAADFNRENPDDPDIRYRSCAFRMKNCFSDILFIVPYIAVKLMDGGSDGFLTPDEVSHGEFIGVYTGTGRRGISHCDEVDLRRRPLSRKAPANDHEISDITEFYVSLLEKLEEK